jgi:diguanylate cyclase (GGDEF)-like protein/PAS domain S-box-containing protein
MTETKRQAYSTLLAEPLRVLKTIFGRVVVKREHQLDTVLNNISQGVCMFDSSQRLVVCNERYLQMYNLSAEVVRPGCTLRELIDYRQAAGLLQDDPEEYCRNILEHNSQERTLEVVAELANGRCIEIINHPLPDGGWVVTHEDITERRRASEESRQAHARLRDAIDILPNGLVFLDAEGRYILWNQQYADIYKRSADLFKPGARLQDTLRIGVARGDYPEAVGREEEWIAERLSKLYNPRGRHEQTLGDGRCILIEERRTSDGGIIGLRVDITEMKQRESSFRLLFEGNPVPMFVYSRENQRILAVNAAAVQHYGYTRAQFLSMSLRHIHDCDSYEELESVGGVLSEQQVGRTWQHLKADGNRIDVAIFARALVHENMPAGLVAAIDITERKRAEARVAHMAHHDALTGLPNRVLLRLRMEEALARMRRTGNGVATLCIDLDNFKSVNDTLGHPCGDHLLQRIAERIRGVMRDEDTAARLGGDEFAILLANVAEPAEVAALARRFLTEISEPFDVMGHQVLIGASVGIALAPGDGDDADRVLKNADLALYRAKADGKGAFRFFEAEMDARAQARRRLEMDLRQAMRAGTLEIHYQPLVQLESGRVSALEALLRWPHPERGFIPPAEFIPIAEETGLIVSLGAHVLRQACADASKWPAHVKLAVNLSPLQFRTGNLFVAVKQALEQTGLSPKRLELEITETLLLEKADHVLATLHALRALGVGISMDDFGTGYSSLSYLRSFPFDKIKIDRSFVHDLGSNAEGQAIVRAILSLGTSLGITITAEGVETDAELACLQAAGCHEGQGYLFSKAQPQAEILKLLAKEAQQAA